MQAIMVLTAPDARDGFRLAGVRQQVLRPEDLEPVLRKLLRDRGLGLLVVDERLQAGLPATRLAELQTGWPGLLVSLPAPREEGAGEDEFERLVRRALGYHLRLQP